MFALCHILPSLESGLNYVLLRKIVIIKHKIRGKEDPCPRACGKRTGWGGVNESGREREMGTKKGDEEEYFLTVENERGGWKRKEEVGSRQWAFYVGVMRASALGRSRACTVDTLRPLSPFFISPLFKARGGNAEVHSHWLQTIQCRCKAACKSAMKNGCLVFWRAVPAQPPCSDTSFICV